MSKANCKHVKKEKKKGKFEFIFSVDYTRHCSMTLSDLISCYGNRQTWTSPSDGGTVPVWCLMRTAHAGFLSDNRHCPMVTSEPFCRTTVFDSGWRAFSAYCAHERETDSSVESVQMLARKD